MPSPGVYEAVQSCIEGFGIEISLGRGIARSMVQLWDGDDGCSQQVCAAMLCNIHLVQRVADKVLIEMDRR